MNIQSKNNYQIPFKESVPENAKIIFIAMHGFCGDKESGCITLLEAAANKDGMGLIKFDWPAHGESADDGTNLRLTNCLSDLETIVQYTKQKYPNAKLVAFGTSFGGYLTLLYNSTHQDFDYTFLRSPAIQMYNVLTNTIMGESHKKALREEGYFDYGFEKMIKITNSFIDDLKQNDILQIYQNIGTINNTTIIHGTIDDLVPFSDSEEFAKNHNIILEPVVGADHRYKKAGELDQVINITMRTVKKLA